MAKRKTPTKQPRKDRNAKNSSPGPVNGQGIEKPQVIDLANLSQFMPASVLNKLKVDPSDGVQDAPPNWGQQIVPQIATVMGRVTAGTQIYWPNDEALRHMRVNAQAMRNDCGIMECLEHRQRATAMLKWHIEPEDPQDTAQKEIAAELQLMLERIGMPIQGSAATSNGFLEYRRFLMEAIWYGRVAIQNAWNWQKIRGKMRCVPTKWIPINGDKLVFRWDDGSGTYEDGQIGIRVTLGGFPAEASSETVKQVEPADYSQAYMLRPYERELLTVHKHIIEDGPFEEPRDAGAIHGVGIRSRIYWTWYQMQNALAWFMEYMERSAFGIEVWTYPANNPAAQAATKESALNRVGGGRTAIMVPVFPGEDSQQYGLKLVEPGLQGVELLKEVVHNFFFHKIKRYILGQTLTSEADATGMGSELATVHLTTFLDVVRFDAQKLGESITTDLVAPMVRYNFPAYRDVFFRFVCDTEAPETEKKLAALAQAWQMGLKIKSADVYALLGISPPDITDEILGRPEPGAGVLQDPNAPQGGGFGGKDQQPTNDNPSGGGGLDIPQDQPNSTDEPSGDGPFIQDKNAKDRNARWITIGSRKDAEPGKKGGFPIQIDDDGKILKGGPKGLRGKHVSEIGNYFKSENEGRTKQGKKRFDEEFSSRSWAKVVEHQAERWDMTPAEYEGIAKDVWDEKARQIEYREQAREDARKRLGVTAGDVGRLENKGIDSGSKSSIKGLDTVGRSLASEYPELGWGGGYGSGDDVDYGALAWDLIREGKQTAPSRTSAEFHEAVEEYLEYTMAEVGKDWKPDYDVPDKFQRQRYAKWDESKHPRADDGKFGEGSGESSADNPNDTMQGMEPTQKKQMRLLDEAVGNLMRDYNFSEKYVLRLKTRYGLDEETTDRIRQLFKDEDQRVRETAASGAEKQKQDRQSQADVYQYLSEAFGKPSESEKSSSAYFETPDGVSIRVSDHAPIYARSVSNINIVTGGPSHKSWFAPGTVVVDIRGKSKEDAIADIKYAIEEWKEENSQ